jgi:TRAP-type C4-dicarboxylate transport system substrate-binding protein
MSRTRIALGSALVVFVVLSASLASAQAAGSIKLASVVPAGSVWDKNLKQMGTEWTEATGGRVTLTVYPGGTQGDEATALRKMRLDALQAAALTGAGLGGIDPAFNLFNIPFFLESYDELNAVTDALTPTLTKRLDSKGFVFIGWGHGGWTQVFTKKPVKTVDDLKKAKLWTSAGNDIMVQWFKANGFEPRAMAMTDIMTGLTTGMVEAVPTTPLAALLFQWYKQTPNMLDIGLAPVVGAVVVTKKAWTPIPAADRPKLMAAAAGLQQRLQDEVPKLDASSITEMTKRGLVVTKASGPEWRAEVGKLAATMRGQMVPKDIYDLALKARDEYRKQHAQAPAGK